MGRKKELLCLPVLRDSGGDLTKKWYVEYSYREPDTDEMQRIRVYKGINQLKTVEERRAVAQTIIDEVRKQIEDGDLPFSQKRRTFQDELLYQNYARRWGAERRQVVTIRMHLSEFLTMKKTEVTPHSYQTYRSKLRIFCEWCEKDGLAEKHVGFIEQGHICAFLQHIAEVNKTSRRTVNKYRQLMHTFFDFMLNTKKTILENPVHDIPQMGVVKDEAARPIPDKERKVLTLYMQKNDPQLWLFCMMEYYCAIRPNELRLLKIGDIDMENQVIRVPKTISKNRSTEYVSIPNQLYRHLSEMKLEQYGLDEFLFSKEGMPGPDRLGVNNFRFRFDRIRNKLGLPSEYKLYSFKHTGGVMLVNAGVSTWELQQHFRHKSISTTEAYIRRNFAPKSKKIKDEFPDM